MSLKRRQLLARLDGISGASEGRNVREMRQFTDKAFDLLTSPETRKAFQIDQEPDGARDSYGRNLYGQCVLLARRLIEAGTRFVCVALDKTTNGRWDTHVNGFPKLKNDLLPELDTAVAGLITDLADRGLLERTLVVVLGEFGREPKINRNAGREHWSNCYSVLLAGGGLKAALVYGSSDKTGAEPNTCPVTPADVIATVYHCLGIPHDLELHDRLGRPLQLVPWGKHVAALLG